MTVSAILRLKDTLNATAFPAAKGNQGGREKIFFSRT